MHANVGTMSNQIHNNLKGGNFYPIETSPLNNNAFVVNTTATSELANSTSNVIAANNLNDSNDNYLDCKIQVVPSHQYHSQHASARMQRQQQ